MEGASETSTHTPHVIYLRTQIREDAGLIKDALPERESRDLEFTVCASTPVRKPPGFPEHLSSVKGGNQNYQVLLPLKQSPRSLFKHNGRRQRVSQLRNTATRHLMRM